MKSIIVIDFNRIVTVALPIQFVWVLSIQYVSTGNFNNRISNETGQRVWHTRARRNWHWYINCIEFYFCIETNRMMWMAYYRWMFCVGWKIEQLLKLKIGEKNNSIAFSFALFSLHNFQFWATLSESRTNQILSFWFVVAIFTVMYTFAIPCEINKYFIQCWCK